MRVLRAATLTAIVCLIAACSSADDSFDDDLAWSSETPIIGGSRANAYPEAALVDMAQNGRYGWACSGSVIAPRVVLTAGHCVYGFSSWRVTAPYAGNQTVTSSSGQTYDWRNTSEYVDPTQHDVGLIILPTPITLTRYPSISSAKLADGSKLVNLGRINNGSFSSTDLFVGGQVTIRDAASAGYPFDYLSSDVIQPGDSGGPCEIPGSPQHEIAAVNSGAGGGTQVLARVDLVRDWIQQVIAANGGSGGGTTPPPAPPPAPPPSPSNPSPIGYFDGFTGGSAYGWTCDPSSYSQAIDVHFYLDGTYATGKFVGATRADRPREAAVGALCGGYSSHGFSFPLPASTLDGRNHTLYAYAINVPAGENPLLGTHSFGGSSPPPGGGGGAMDGWFDVLRTWDGANHDLVYPGYTGAGRVEGRVFRATTKPSSGMRQLYNCKIGNDTFVSPDSGCEGQQRVGTIGWVHSYAASDRVAFYRCIMPGDHFVSSDSACEGMTREGRLGYWPR